MTLGVGDVLVDVAEAGDDGQRFGQSLSLLNAIDVGLVGMLARRADDDDAIWARYLELEVGVVGDSHQLGVAWSSQNHVVGPREPNHVKSKNQSRQADRSTRAGGLSALAPLHGMVMLHSLAETY